MARPAARGLGRARGAGGGGGGGGGGGAGGSRCVVWAGEWGGCGRVDGVGW